MIDLTLLGTRLRSSEDLNVPPIYTAVIPNGGQAPLVQIAQVHTRHKFTASFLSRKSVASFLWGICKRTNGSSRHNSCCLGLVMTVY
jgi:hypothetical protein